MTEEQQRLPECETKPAGMLQDEKGNGSSSRLVKVMWVAGLIGILSIVEWRSNPVVVPDVPWGIVMITLIIIGGGAVGKWMELGGTLQGIMKGEM